MLSNSSSNIEALQTLTSLNRTWLNTRGRLIFTLQIKHTIETVDATCGSCEVN